MFSGRDYSVEEIGNLPKDLHLKNFAVKPHEKWLIFGGIHNRYYFLSHFYKVPLAYKNIEFEDLYERLINMPRHLHLIIISVVKTSCARLLSKCC